MKRLAIYAAAFTALAAVSTTSFAVEPVDQQPLLLSTVQLDLIDAGTGSKYGHRHHRYVNRAEADAWATAQGRRTYTDAWAETHTSPGSSESYAYAYSSSRGGKKGGRR